VDALLSEPKKQGEEEMFCDKAHNASRYTASAALRLLSVCTLLANVLALTPMLVTAEEPGRGLTARFEVRYLRFIIDHHFAALRMTELAAGTDTERNAEISPTEGTSPSPDFSPTVAKASLHELKSLARRNNRMQREEILTAQQFLREWYGIEYTPRLTPENQRAIASLEDAQAGRTFDIEFMKIFSQHHYDATIRSVQCLVGSELTHKDLERYCRGIVNVQLQDIDEMRHLLCNAYGICDYQPFGGSQRQHSEP
jgi:uncharacterized protein (DUF305 family)